MSNGIDDMITVKLLTIKELNFMGIQNNEHKLKILKFIQILKEE